MSHHEARENVSARSETSLPDLARGLNQRHAGHLKRWVSVDVFLKAYDNQRDPNGHYGTPGRDPQNFKVAS